MDNEVIPCHTPIQLQKFGERRTVDSDQDLYKLVCTNLDQSLQSAL